jgi:hypothetical protein
MPHEAGRKKRHDNVFVLAAIATMGLAAGDSSLAKAAANRLDRLAIEVAETVKTVACASGQSSEELAELIGALEGHRDLRMHRVGTCLIKTTTRGRAASSLLPNTCC